MGEAREVMDRLTDAAVKGDSEALKSIYAQDAVGWAPDVGTITGGDQIAAYLGEFAAAFPDASWEPLYKHEAGDRRGIFRWDEHRRDDGAERRDHSRDGQACAPSRVRHRDGRERGCHEPSVLL